MSRPSGPQADPRVWQLSLKRGGRPLPPPVVNENQNELTECGCAFLLLGSIWFAFWDGQGLPLCRPDVWINPDDQSRWFPTRQALAREPDAARFEIRFHELHNHRG